MFSTSSKLVFSPAAGAGSDARHAGQVSVAGALANDVAVLKGEHGAQFENAHAARLIKNIAELVVGHVFA